MNQRESATHSFQRTNTPYRENNPEVQVISVENKTRGRNARTRDKKVCCPNGIRVERAWKHACPFELRLLQATTQLANQALLAFGHQARADLPVLQRSDSSRVEEVQLKSEASEESKIAFEATEEEQEETEEEGRDKGRGGHGLARHDAEARRHGGVADTDSEDQRSCEDL